MLRDDDTVYKALTPDFDFLLDRGDTCYISEVVIWPGDSGPNEVEVYGSNSIDRWGKIKTFTCSRSGSSKLVIPGEYLTKFIRIRCLNNIRGGQIVSVRYIMVKGLNKQEGIPRENLQQPRLVPQQ